MVVSSHKNISCQTFKNPQGQKDVITFPSVGFGTIIINTTYVICCGFGLNKIGANNDESFLDDMSFHSTLWLTLKGQSINSFV